VIGLRKLALDRLLEAETSPEVGLLHHRLI
jgi:hypothetical protein